MEPLCVEFIPLAFQATKVRSCLRRRQSGLFGRYRVTNVSAGKLTMPACENTIAYMNSIQYTIRSIPPKLDSTLRRCAQKTGKSLNEVTIDALIKGAGIAPNASFDDLNWFIGNKSLNEQFDKAMEWLDDAPKEIQ